MEYAKAAPNDILIRVRIDNRGPKPWTLHMLPTLWFRNGWSWGRTGEGYWPEPAIRRVDDTHLACEQESWANSLSKPSQTASDFYSPRTRPIRSACSTRRTGPLCEGCLRSLRCAWRAGSGQSAADGNQSRRVLPRGNPAGKRHRTALPAERGQRRRGSRFRRRFRAAHPRSESFLRMRGKTRPPQVQIVRQAYASLLWSKQFYHFGVLEWLEGDPAFPRRRRSMAGPRLPLAASLQPRCRSRSRTTGSSPGTHRGTLRSTWLRSPRSIPISPRSSSFCCCANGTRIRAGRFRPTNLRSAT